ncbi:tripartite tricarboxylate transporter substrate binding protein [Paucibacter sp. Y2R2-4]|uniref:tripartite tricarboxylate transporter substrate binding protein n=1 Tax=Paucibacter sp. Y2R2-4 TaxID=2893553 RepID=UPI0021E3D03C|nr:tripartite tricarboxylate transporter substrate binding protein [Paucibacter sp. Y2R2-4]MCV2348944.1 tripartite tricarboxylate transporter substrate binding protein [Paucibacter sp. Y2R2-4]
MSLPSSFLFRAGRHGLAVLLIAFVSLGAQAQPASSSSSAPGSDFPSKPVRLLVGNTPGSAADVVARYVGQHLGEQWKQPVLVDNRAGAAGVLAVDAVTKAPADGHTLLLGADGPITILPSLQASLPYDPERDLAPVALLAETDFVLVAHPKTGFRTLQDLIAAAKRQPGKLNYASAGNGSPQQFAMETLKQRAGIFLTHIPYRGGPLGLADVISGQVDVMFIAVGPALQHIKTGKLVALATGGRQPHALLPQVPPVADSFKGFKAGTWFGLFAPVNTPKPVLDQLRADVQRLLSHPAAREDLAAQGVQVVVSDVQHFREQLRADARRFQDLVKTACIKVEL